MAKKPKRPGKSRSIPAANSLQARDSRLASATSPNHTPGVEIEVIDTAMPVRSIVSIDFAGVQLITCAAFASLRDAKARADHLGIGRRHDVMVHVDQLHAESLTRGARRTIAWHACENAR